MNIIKKLFSWVFKKELSELDASLAQASKANDLLIDSIGVLRIKLHNVDEMLTKVSKQEKVLTDVLKSLDVSVDLHENNKYARSWAVISIQGEKMDYLKFIDLGDGEIRDIANFLRRYERKFNIKIDCAPDLRMFREDYRIK